MGSGGHKSPQCGKAAPYSGAGPRPRGGDGAESLAVLSRLPRAWAARVKLSLVFTIPPIICPNRQPCLPGGSGAWTQRARALQTHEVHLFRENLRLGLHAASLPEDQGAGMWATRQPGSRPCWRAGCLRF